jgi:hypothetical protein
MIVEYAETIHYNSSTIRPGRFEFEQLPTMRRTAPCRGLETRRVWLLRAVRPVAVAPARRTQ